MNITLDTPVQYIPRVGPVMAKRLEKLEIHSVADLLYHIPFRYNDYSLTRPIIHLRPGETVTIHGTVVGIKNVFTKSGKKMQQAVIKDATGKITATWFNQPFLINTLKPDTLVYLSGNVDWFSHTLVIHSPEYEIVQTDSHLLHTGRIVPVYPETEGVSSKWLRGRIAYILDQLETFLVDVLPLDIQKKYSLIPLLPALKNIHFPTRLSEVTLAHKRLAFDELFLVMLEAARSARLWKKTQIAQPIHLQPEELTSLIRTLPFELTDDQKRTVQEIIKDVGRPVPMNRLLEGDVGSGKTVVAAISMYAAYRSGLQSILMAPTEILAKQHFQTIRKFLSPLGIDVGLVTGSTNHESRITTNDIYIGTHALLSKSLQFDRVGLIVIDEQQRFGVNQRLILRKKGEGKFTPHLLTMTATPIPRTVARVLYGNLDLSILSKMPVGRTPVKTWVVPNEKRKAAYEWINKQIDTTGCQAFIVCPLIEESESLMSVRAVTKEYTILKKTVFPKLRIGLLHGRLPSKDKTDVLEQFRHHRYDILLTTPVVEVGIDVPRATIMVVEASERFGLSQLHQLRGRVGRGSQHSYCLLFTEKEEEKTLRRLKAMETTSRGAELAELDLTIRGPGELFGTKQHGALPLTIASLSDSNLLFQAQEAVQTLMTVDPELTMVPLLRDKLKTGTIVED